MFGFGWNVQWTDIKGHCQDKDSDHSIIGEVFENFLTLWILDGK